MAGDLITALCRDPRRAAAITHVHHRPSQAAETTGWPAWADPTLVERLEESGIPAPWVHQREAADLAWGGSNVVVATGTGSGKSLAYLLPALTALAGERDRVLYLAPTKALAADQLRAVEELGLDWVRAARLDGDTPREDRSWVRAHANLVLTNPDMVHRSVLPQHQRFRSLTARVAFRRHRRMPLLPGRFRQPCRTGHPATTTRLRSLRRRSDVHSDERDDGRAGQLRRAAWSVFRSPRSAETPPGTAHSISHSTNRRPARTTRRRVAAP